MLNGLSQVVVRADDTYEEVYHNQLVRQDRLSKQPEELDWNAFVQEARQTGPLFLEGKESLRDAVANLHRLIRRAPEHLRSMMYWLQRQETEDATWYLSKVLTLVQAVHGSMEVAADKFSRVDMAIEGMTRDARENEEHFESRVLRLEGEAKALELPSVAQGGKWEQRRDAALYGCQLTKLRAALEACKMQCIEHESGSCTQLTYYKTASGNNCYLHCESAAPSQYTEADTFVLARAPAELASDAAERREAGQAASVLRRRWRAVREMLSEVSRLVRRFRGATADLRRSLEDARFVANDLQAAFRQPARTADAAEAAAAAAIAEGGSSAGGGRSARMMEHLVGDVVAAIEDLSESLAPLRFQ